MVVFGIALYWIVQELLDGRRYGMGRLLRMHDCAYHDGIIRADIVEHVGGYKQMAHREAIGGKQGVQHAAFREGQEALQSFHHFLQHLSRSLRAILPLYIIKDFVELPLCQG